MKRYLFFDTETTGLIDNWTAPLEVEAHQYPRIVEIAGILTDEQGRVIEIYETLVEQESIPEAASKVHGITLDQVQKLGVSESVMLDKFMKLCSKADLLVCHNFAYDSKLVLGTMYRNHRHGNIMKFREIESYCTKEAGTYLCKIPNKHYKPGRSPYKWPTLEELYQHCFGETLKQDHRALSDVNATIQCFFHIRKPIAKSQ